MKYLTTAHVALLRRGGIDTGLVARALGALQWPPDEWCPLDEAAVSYYRSVKLDIDDIIRPKPAKHCCPRQRELLQEAGQVIADMAELMQSAGFDSRSAGQLSRVRQRAAAVVNSIREEMVGGNV
jgi:hypothetical protein